MKLRVFVPKVATIGPFHKPNAKQGWIYQMVQCQKSRVQNDDKTFFDLHLLFGMKGSQKSLKFQEPNAMLIRPGQ